MQLVNLLNKQEITNFEDALWNGLSKDGGLYYPKHIVPFTNNEVANFSELDFQAIALTVLSNWLDGEIPKQELKKIVDNAFNFDIPMVDVGPFKVLELFHGPTMAFKDVAARFLAQCFEYYATKRKKPVNIIVATSGDTGGAIADAFSGLKNVKVFILFPKGRVSELQYIQLTKNIDNVEPLEIDGSFDECQKLVKQALADATVSERLSSANSINIGRLLPQSTYYSYVSSLIGSYEAVIPTGNLGNATAALLAHEINFGPKHITLAVNGNDTLQRYYKSGNYEPKTSLHTFSNAMDVSNPNNFPRFIEPFEGNVQEFRKLVDVFSVDDVQTVLTIKKVYSEFKYILDPHTAVAWRAAEESQNQLTKVIVSTASPVKFAKEIFSKTGIEVDGADTGINNSEADSKKTQISAEYNELKSLLLKRCLK